MTRQVARAPKAPPAAHHRTAAAGRFRSEPLVREPIGRFDRLVSEPEPSLAKAIQSQFAPTLRRDGFSGTSKRYWRAVGGQCQVVEVQGSRSGGKFAVNMGIQPMLVPLLWGGAPEPKRIRE